jgi:hypothetical protein
MNGWVASAAVPKTRAADGKLRIDDGRLSGTTGKAAAMKRRSRARSFADECRGDTLYPTFKEFAQRVGIGRC